MKPINMFSLKWCPVPWWRYYSSKEELKELLYDLQAVIKEKPEKTLTHNSDESFASNFKGRLMFSHIKEFLHLFPKTL